MNCCISKEIVREIMNNRNIKTQSELAEKLGITKNQLSFILSDKNSPIKSNIQSLADVLGVSPVDLIIDASSNSSADAFVKNIISGESSVIINNQNYIDVSTVVSKKAYTSLELFAGAGGLACGLEMAGFAAVGFVEIDKIAAATLRKNRPDWNVIEEDIINVAKNGIFKYIPENTEIDFLSGGYPCQSFSYAGQKRGLDDVRGTLFFYYAQILAQIMPKVFLAENVKGLISHDGGKTLKTMIEVFENVGYRVVYHVLRATEYGVAQKRERTVIVGIRKDLDIEYLPPKPYDYTPVLRDVLKNVPPSPGEQYPEKKKKILSLVPPGGYWRDLPKDLAKDYMGKSYFSGGGRTGMARRISWDEPCLTLTCSPAQKQTERCHPDEVRPFTVREYARIQSFPDNWEFLGSPAAQYKQIGNAVPVNMAHAIGLSIIDVLNKTID
ncbi:MAG: DNA (cytosine-5-)-methyltransferase [Saccharofermentanales bacterium]